MKKDKTFRPDRVLSYFKAEWLPLAFVTLSGLVYNIGLLATPWFEGRLAQCLADILGGSETAAKMAMLVLAYIVVTLAVQAARFIKRFYVRRFANNINRRMKGILYANLVRQSRAALEKEGAGELIGPGQLSLIGGQTAFWVKTRGDAGQIHVTASCPRFGWTGQAVITVEN